MPEEVVHAPLQKIEDPVIEKAGIALYIKREDLIHTFISGNKWRKLKYNLQEALKQKKDTLLSFGGAFSNHIYALAAAGEEFGFNTIGVIRGKDASPDNPTLKFAKKRGMVLHFVDREEYKQKDNPKFLESLRDLYGDFYPIPEGGSNALAVKGCREIVKDISIDYNYICCPCGTGTTLAGIIAEVPAGKKVIGFSALKSDGYFEKEIPDLIGTNFDNWNIVYDYHFGGYAKITPELIGFMREFEKKTTIPLDPIYTGKMLYGIYDMIEKGYFTKGSKLISVHTGGLQGIEGMKQKIETMDKQSPIF